MVGWVQNYYKGSNFCLFIRIVFLDCGYAVGAVLIFLFASTVYGCMRWWGGGGRGGSWFTEGNWTSGSFACSSPPHSKTIVHPAESRSSRPAQEAADTLSKENVQPMDSPARKKAKQRVGSKPQASPVSAVPLRTAVMGSGKKPGGGQRQSSSQQGKPQPKEGKKCRRRLLPPIKGQKSITSFFRV